MPGNATSISSKPAQYLLPRLLWTLSRGSYATDHTCSCRAHSRRRSDARRHHCARRRRRDVRQNGNPSHSCSCLDLFAVVSQLHRTPCTRSIRWRVLLLIRHRTRESNADLTSREPGSTIYTGHPVPRRHGPPRSCGTVATASQTRGEATARSRPVWRALRDRQCGGNVVERGGSGRYALHGIGARA